jgi:PAS domain S-box-containing protein
MFKLINKNIKRLGMIKAIKEQLFAIIVFPIVFFVIIVAVRYWEGDLFFHSLIEIFTILIGITMGVVAYFTYQFTKNNFLLYLGIGYFWIAVFDLFHMLTYKGMMIHSVDSANITLTFWIFSRALEALLIVTALFINFSILSKTKVFSIFGFYFAFVYWLTFSPYCPDLFIEGVGLTFLKIASEYAIIALLILALFIYKKHKNLLDTTVYQYMIYSILFTIISELAFTLYLDIGDYTTVLGHLFKFLSFYIIFLAIVQASLQKPFMFLAQESNTYNAIPMPAIVVDRDGIIRQINKATESFLKLTKDEIIHRSNHTLFHDKNIKESECKICKIIHNGDELSFYEVCKNSQTYSFTISPIHLTNELAGAIQICVDITDKKIAKNRLITANKLLKNTERMGHIGSWEFDLQTKTLLWSDEVFRIHGEEVNAFIPTIEIAMSYMSEKDQLKVRNNISLIMAGKKTEPTHYNIIRRDGTVRKVQIREEIILSDNGTPVKAIGILYDETKRLASKQELIKLQTAIEQTPVSIIITDIEANIEYVNPYFSKLTGYTAEEVIGKNPSLLSSGYTTKDEYIQLWNKITNNETWSGRFKNIKKNGEEYWESAIISPIKDEEEKIVNYIGIKQDISEKIAFEGLLKDQEELMIAQSRLAAMGEMIGMIAHQWRQPLSVISMGANNLLIDIELDNINISDFKEEANSIINQVNHLSKTIEDFQNFFRPDREKESVNIKDVIYETLGIVGTSLKNNDIKTDFSFSPTPNIQIYRRELIQVLISIIYNAKEAMNEHCKDEKILFIHIKEETDSIIIEICDNGGGIDEKIIDKIFEPYFTTKSEQTGTGLGLYMSKTIMNKHLNGEIIAKNNKKNGVCMIVSLNKEELV